MSLIHQFSFKWFFFLLKYNEVIEKNAWNYPSLQHARLTWQTFMENPVFWVETTRTQPQRELGRGGWSDAQSCVRPAPARPSCTCPFVSEHHKSSGSGVLSATVQTLPDKARKGFLSYTLNQGAVILDDTVEFGRCGAEERQDWAPFLNESSQASLKTKLYLLALVSKTKCW